MSLIYLPCCIIINSFEDGAFVTKSRDANVPVQKEGTEDIKQDKAQTDKALGAPNPMHTVVTIWSPPRSIYI